MGIGRVTIPAGQTSGTIRLNTIAGNINTRETVTVKLNSVISGAATIGIPASAQAGILEAEFPAVPVLDLNYAADKALTNGETFTRSSSGSYVDAAGLIAIAGIDQPRFGHDPNSLASLGFLCENQQTNLCTESEDFGPWTNSGASSVLRAAEVDPTGATGTVHELEEVTTGSTVHMNFLSASGVAAGQVSTVSCFIKRAKGTRNARMQVAGGANGYRANFDPDTGQLVNTEVFGNAQVFEARSEAYPNNWYRVWVTGIHSTSDALSQIRIYLMDGTTENYPGVGGTHGFFVWGYQLEHNSQASSGSNLVTSYISTSGSTVTRSADGNGQGAIFDPIPWDHTYPLTFMIEAHFSPLTSVEDSYLPTLFGFTESNVSEAHSFQCRRDDGPGGTNINFVSASPVGGTDFSTTDAFDDGANPHARFAVRMALNDFNHAIDGVAFAQDTSVSPPVVDRASIGSYPLFNVRNAGAHIARFVVWDVGLTDAQLAEVTTLP